MPSKHYSPWRFFFWFFLWLFNFHHINSFREWNSVNWSAVSPIRRNEGLSEGERERERGGANAANWVWTRRKQHGTQEWGNELNNGTRLPVPSVLPSCHIKVSRLSAMSLISKQSCPGSWFCLPFALHPPLTEQPNKAREGAARQPCTPPSPLTHTLITAHVSYTDVRFTSVPPHIHATPCGRSW